MRRRSKSNGGQFLILSAVALVIFMITFASLIAYSSVSTASLNATDFKKVTSEVTQNFRSALAIALAETSMDLDREASVVRYSNYTNLETDPAACNEAYAFLTEWQKATQKNYPGQGLNLTISDPILTCDWSGSPGYSLIDSSFGLDILAYRFYGWRASASIGLNLTVLSLVTDSTDGKTVAFYFQVLDGSGMPITDVSPASIKAFFGKVESTEFTLSNGVNMTYVGSGNYFIKVAMYPYTILSELSSIRSDIQEMEPSYFVNGSTALRDQLVAMMNQTIAAYDTEAFTLPYYDFITENIRTKLVPGGPGSWVTSSAPTDNVTGWIDVVRTQVLPTVRIALQDSRGVVVGASETLYRSSGPDLLGPITQSTVVSPNPTGGSSTVSLTASIDDLSTGFSDVISAEYFVGTIGGDGTGIAMSAEDGSFDSSFENVRATVSVSGWTTDSYILYVHGKDSAGNWGATRSVTLNVTQAPGMYIYSMTSQVYSQGSRTRYVRITVTVWDTSGRVVSNARVYGTWSGSVSGSSNRLTDSNGRVVFTSPSHSRPATFTFTVTNIVKSGWIYNPALNRVSNVITVYVS
ncbi:MAG TPA: hypothetical protein VJ574_02570 [Candidatus Bathyarchaeia archaeon]|nr:hypothetical protein [Candidatus Bathyarchaeia archaeon]